MAARGLTWRMSFSASTRYVAPSQPWSVFYQHWFYQRWLYHQVLPALFLPALVLPALVLPALVPPALVLPALVIPALVIPPGSTSSGSTSASSCGVLSQVAASLSVELCSRPLMSVQRPATDEFAVQRTGLVVN